MIKKCLLVIIFILLITASGIFAQQENRLAVTVHPLGTVPLGSSTELFKFGMGVDASVIFLPAILQYVGVGAGFNYTNLPLATENSITVLSGYAGPAVRIPFGDRLSIFATGKAGYYYWTPVDWDAEDTNGGGFAVGGSLGALFRIAGPLTLGASVEYDYFTNLYNAAWYSPMQP